MLDLLTGDAMLNIVDYVALDSRPRVALLNPRQHLAYTLMSHFVVRTIWDLALIQLRHYYHARPDMQGSLLRDLAHAQYVVAVDQQ